MITKNEVINDALARHDKYPREINRYNLLWEAYTKAKVKADRIMKDIESLTEALYQDHVEDYKHELEAMEAEDNWHRHQI